MLLAASFYLVPLLTATTACAKYFANGASEKYTNEWSVQISSNNEIEAERVATEVKSIMKGELQIEQVKN